MQPNEAPQEAGLESGYQGPPPGGLGLSQRPVFQAGYGPQSMGEAYQPAGQRAGQQDNVNFRQQYMENMDRKRMEDAEDVDVNASIHGNWTMENAKSMLHQFIQMNKIKADYTYSTMGPDHNRSFVAEMGFYVHKLGRNIHAREAGSNKHSASKSCALSLVRQLFHLGVIEAFSGTLKKNKEVEDLPPYEVNLAPEMVGQVRDCISSLGYTPVDPSGMLNFLGYFIHKQSS